MKTGFYAREFKITSRNGRPMVQLSPMDPEAYEIMDIAPEELLFDKKGLLIEIRRTEQELPLEMPTGANIFKHPDMQTLETAYGALAR